MSSSSEKTGLWVWWICGLLLLASTINYMDRQTLSNTSKRITDEFQLSEEQYGNLELAFGLAFAVGATVFGIIADKGEYLFQTFSNGVCQFLDQVIAWDGHSWEMA